MHLLTLLYFILTPTVPTPITDQGFIDWSERCEDAGGYAVQASDGAWDCIDGDDDGDQQVVLILD